MMQLVRVPNLVAVMGGLHSPVASAELETIHENKIVYLLPWANATQLVENGYRPNYVFRVSAADKYVGEYLVEEALKTSDRSPCFWRTQPGGEATRRRWCRPLPDAKSPLSRSSG